MHHPLTVDRLDKLARMEPSSFPLLSLYLNTEVAGTGRHTYDIFVRKELHDRLKTLAEDSSDRDSLAQDIQRVELYLERELEPSTRGLALFSCYGLDFFDAFQFDVPFDRHRLVIGDRPHLYPLARLHDQYPRYAALLLDSHSARIFVFSTGMTEQSLNVQSPKTKHVKVGGWSQARYQRHVENAHLLHAKEVVERLDALVAAEGLEHIVVAGDEVIVAVLKAQMPERLASKLVDVLRLQIRSPEHEMLAATLEALRRKDQETDESFVRELLDQYRAGGLAVVGVKPTRNALQSGQVDTLAITATPEQIAGDETSADEMVRLAQQTSAAIRFIEDPGLLQPIGGVGARLRYLV